MSTWGPRLPQLRADLGVDNATIGLVLAGVTVGSIAGLAAAAALLAWLGSRRAIGAMLWLAGAGVAVIGTAPAWPTPWSSRPPGSSSSGSGSARST